LTSDAILGLFTVPSPPNARAPLKMIFGDGDRVGARRTDGMIDVVVCILGCEWCTRESRFIVNVVGAGLVLFRLL